MDNEILIPSNASFFIFLKEQNSQGNDVTIMGYKRVLGEDYVRLKVEKGEGCLKFDNEFESEFNKIKTV